MDPLPLEKACCYSKIDDLLYNNSIIQEFDVAFLVILIVLIMQRLTHIVHRGDLPRWLSTIFKQLQRLEKRPLFEKSVYAQVLGMLILLPLVLGIFSFFLSRTNILVTFCFGLIVLWYCLGDSQFKQCGKTQGINALFISTYTHVFAIIFWFIILGPVGAALYYSVNVLLAYFEQQEVKSANHIQVILKIRALLDWVPVRLLGLTFALVGHFFMATSDWLKHLVGGLELNQNLVAEFGKKAINLKVNNLKEQKEHALFLIERALWLWLIVLSIITLVLWIG